MISQAYFWLIDGLAATILDVEQRLRPQQRFQLRADDRPFLLRGLDDRNLSFAVPADGSDGELEPLAADLLRQIRGSRLEIVVPDTAVLEVELEPLPAESRAYVDNLVRHRLETLFPWRAADTLFASEVTDRADGDLSVNVRATPRNAVTTALDLAIACGAAEAAVIRESERNLTPAKVISAFESTEKHRGLERSKSLAHYTFIGLILFATALTADAMLDRAALQADIKGLDHTISERQAIQRSRLDRQTTQGVLAQRKKEAIVAVPVLEELSKILPDDTYLTDLTMDSGQLRISGVSARAADLIPLLEGSGKFRNATFYTPTTRQAEGLDHFSIEMGIVSRGANE